MSAARGLPGSRPAADLPRRRTLLAAWLVVAGALLLRAAQIQLGQAPLWREIADAQHTTAKEVAAARGAILDRDGVPLAVARERIRVAVAPHEIADPDVVAGLLSDVLGVPRAESSALVSSERRWVTLPGGYPPAVRERLSGTRGVYLERAFDRFHPHGELARGALGAVVDGEGRGGVEQAFDDHLRGAPGREVVARDHSGRPIPGETFLVEEARPGGDLVLTLDAGLQAIAEEALADALDRSGADGGDVLVTDPHTGELLALASMRRGSAAALSAVNTPFEPGSTLKPFTVAGLLARGLATLSDSIDVEGGTWTVEGRTLHDVHRGEERITLADALRLSSNVGVAKAARAMDPGHQYENLRDFGFGVPTGIELPGEVGGTLRRPDRWSRVSAASLAIGYELSVTPVQMAMAYGAFANGGLLMQPRLVAEVRDARGRTLGRPGARVVRRVLGRDVARAVSAVLEEVVEEGTGGAARLSEFRVAGKSGTSRAYTAGAGYLRGDYHASFVGFFPAEDPQLAIFVKLERPRAGYYGGSVAAPVTRATLEAALAARGMPLDRDRLLRAARRPASAPPPPPLGVRFASLEPEPSGPTVDLAAVRGAPVSVGAGDASRVPVPELAGLPVRVAVRRLHALGLRVALAGAGDVVGSFPGPGTGAQPGDTVRLHLRGRSGG